MIIVVYVKLRVYQNVFYDIIRQQYKRRSTHANGTFYDVHAIRSFMNYNRYKIYNVSL